MIYPNSTDTLLGWAMFILASAIVGAMTLDHSPITRILGAIFAGMLFYMSLLMLGLSFINHYSK